MKFQISISKRKFILTTLVTLILLNLLRLFCQRYCLQTEWYQTILYDNFHHYQVGLILIPLAIFFLKRMRKTRDFILAISAGLIIDESMYPLYSLGFTTFSHYHWHGIAFEIAVFLVYSSLVLQAVSSSH